mmetsp:Transcript_39614/g.122903  ORF Transcript_39614/g.122903 Transcript_39614/m.122903 type:complete len:220 (-) Transcript_39614:404-1063(-)
MHHWRAVPDHRLRVVRLQPPLPGPRRLRPGVGVLRTPAAGPAAVEADQRVARAGAAQHPGPSGTVRRVGPLAVHHPRRTSYARLRRRAPGLRRGVRRLRRQRRAAAGRHAHGERRRGLALQAEDHAEHGRCWRGRLAEPRRLVGGGPRRRRLAPLQDDGAAARQVLRQLVVLRRLRRRPRLHARGRRKGRPARAEHHDGAVPLHGLLKRLADIRQGNRG